MVIHNLPLVVRSQETYEYLGFNADVAASLWILYENKDPALPYDLVDFAKYHLYNVKIKPGSSYEQCKALLSQGGLQGWLVDAILMPEYEGLRGTAPCMYWVLDAMKMRFEALEAMHSTCQTRLEIGMRNNEHLRRIPAPEIQEGYTMIYRADSILRCKRLYDEDTGLLNFGHLFKGQGDFEGCYRRMRMYWTPQWDFAKLCADWARYRSGNCATGIVQVAVPNGMLQKDLSQIRLWADGLPSEQCNWRRMVWTSRARRWMYCDLLAIETLDLIIGHIASGATERHAMIGAPEDIGLHDCLEIETEFGTEKTIQWAFYGPFAIECLQLYCTARAWILRRERVMETAVVC